MIRFPWKGLLLLGGITLAALYVVAEKVWPASDMNDLDARGDRGLPGFPEVTASNLEGRRYTLPRDFEGDANLCLIAFEQEQQADVDTWLEGVRPLREAPGFEVYELPTLGKGTPLFRGFLDGAMQRGIPDVRQREHTITLYLDKGEFRRTLGLPDESRVYALLVDHAGSILWREEGPFTGEKGRSLRAALGDRVTD